MFVSADRDELLQAAISVGTASELLLKALVHATSPALLANRGDRDSLLLLANATAERPNPLGFRSITAAEVYTLAKHLHRTLPIDVPRMEPLVARNSAAHLGIVDRVQLRRAVIQHCKLAQAVLPLLELDDAPFWGESLLPSVSALIDEAKSEIARIVAMKIASAQESLQIKIGSLPRAAQVAYLAALSGAPTSNPNHKESEICPACKERGWLLCIEEIGPVTHNPRDASNWVSRTAYPFGFECNVCGLELEDGELGEIDAFPGEIELEPVDVVVDLTDVDPFDPQYELG